MKQYTAQNIINIALLGHGSSGKTTLADAILYSAGLIDRVGKVEDGTATLDFDAEEKKRKVSVSTAVYQMESADKKINIIDAPGLFDFAGGVSEALTAADSVLVVLSGKSGLAVGAQQSVDKAKKLKKGCAFFIGKLNSSHANFGKVYASLQEKYGSVLAPVVVPYMEGEAVGCYVNLLSGKAYKYDGFKATECPCPTDKAVEAYRAQLVEAVAGVDEELMEKFFEGETLTEAELIAGIKKGTAAGDIYPVLAGAGATGEAVDMLVDSVAKIMPTADMGTYKIKEGEDVKSAAIDAAGQPALLVFKTIADPFVGKLSYFKVLSGSVKGDTKLVNVRTGNEERLAKVMWLKGGKQEDATEIMAGDIGSVAKLGDVITGDTLAAPAAAIEAVGVPA
ncbi:MAG: elongation factor G, partial [Clostridia bacterium]|nr:elongation factor G [Clostridia bacterium]